MSNNLRELYQEVIIDHGRKPRNFGKCENSTHQQEGYNPLCGDQITIYLEVKDDVVKDVKFEGAGCAISIASASLLSQAIKDKSIKEIDQLFTAFHQLVTQNKNNAKQNATLGKLQILSGVREYPTRVKCATLAWHTLLAALTGKKDKVISTE